MLGPVNTIAISKDNRNFISGGADGSIKLVDIATKAVLHSFWIHQSKFKGIVKGVSHNYCVI